MKSHITFSKKDIAVTLGCLIFLLANLGAIGASGRRRAKEAVCTSNLRQLGTCFELYTSDNEGYFHGGWMGTPDCRTNHWWTEAIRPYYQQENLCLCPMASKLSCDVGLGEVGQTFVSWSECYNWLPEGTYGSYGINGWVEHRQCDDGNYQWMDALRWRTPNVLGGDNIPLLLGSPWVDGWPQHNDTPPPAEDMHPNSTSSMGRFCINRHDGYINALFLDFSVRKVGLKELWTLKWHRESNTCGPWTSCGGVMPSDWPDWMRDFEDY